jgi:glyoxylase-like metal-dependent hydrolase (beta-lactamase superfamily II)
VIVERSLHPQFLSNTYLVADRRGGTGAFIDAGGPLGPLLDAVDRHGVTPTHVLLTHHHYDHVCEVGDLIERWPALEVLIHPLEHSQVAAATGTLEPDAVLSLGGLEVRALPTPGHTAGMLSLLVSAGESGPGEVFTGDTLFRNSVGGVRAPGHTTYDDLRRSIMDTLMDLPPETVIRPGHTDPSTVAEEWEHNPFIRVWRGLDPEGQEPCTALGKPATLILLAEDYDGGRKAWVRWPDGSDDIVPGSQITRGEGDAQRAE